MSNFVYNETFTPLVPDPKPELEPSSKKSNSRVAMIILLCACAVIFLLIGLLIGVLIKDDGTKVTTNTIYNAPPSEIIAQDGKDITLADIVASIKDSVVEIKTEYVVHSYFQAIKSGAGSGVIVSLVDANGKRAYDIITNAHVIEGETPSSFASSITVTLTDGTSYSASVVGYDTTSDIAVLRIFEAEKTLTCASFATGDSVRVGDGVIAIGNPLGSLGGSVTTGIISALDREIEIDGNIMTLMQTNAAINPGNSGGGLFDLSGRLIGVVNAKSSGTGIEGLGFAIPAKTAQKMYSDIFSYGYVKDRAYIGAVFAKYYDGSIRVYSLEEGYNNTALRAGDKIVSVNGTEITEVSQISSIVRNAKIGSTIEFKVIRNKAEITVSVSVYEYAPN